MYSFDDHVKRHSNEASQGMLPIQSTPFPASSPPTQWSAYDPNQTTSQSPFQPQTLQTPPNQFMFPPKSPFAQPTQPATTTGQLPADPQNVTTEDLPNDPK